MTDRAKVKKCAPSPVPGDGAAGAARRGRGRRVVFALAVGGVLAALLTGSLVLQRRSSPPSEVWLVSVSDPADTWPSVAWQCAREAGGVCDARLEVCLSRQPAERVLLTRSESPMARWFDDTIGTDWAYGEILGRWELVGSIERWPDGRWACRAIQSADGEQVVRELVAEERAEEVLESADAAASDDADE